MIFFNSIYLKNKGYILTTILILAGIGLIVPGGTWISKTEDIWASELEETRSPESEDSLDPGNENAWISRLEEQIARIDENMSGRLGVYVKLPGDNHALSYNAEDYWYLSSTIKVPLAIAVLQRAETGELSLDDELTLRESDFVDGAGNLLWQEPGTRYTIETLLEKMIKNSDSSATDMLMRHIGEEEFNKQIQQKMVSRGFNPITTILQVRYDAYSEFHENISNLTNTDILYVHSTRSRPERVERLMERMAVDKSELRASSIEEAFERYYKRGLNSAQLASMGLLLERLYTGELLSRENTLFLLEIMESITTGDRRIKAGLPEGTRFAQKTGTQIESACNAGIIIPDKAGNQPVIVAACIENFGNINEAEKAFEYLARLLTESLLQ